MAGRISSFFASQGKSGAYGQRTQLRSDYARNAKNRGIVRGGFKSRFSTTQTRYYQKFNVNSPLGTIGRGSTGTGRGSINTGATAGIRSVKSFLSTPVGSKSIGGTLASSIRSLKGSAGSYAADVRSVNTGAVKNFLEVKNAIPGFIRGSIAKRAGRAFERSKALNRLDRTLSKVGDKVGRKIYQTELKVRRAIGRTAPAKFIGSKLKRLDKKLQYAENRFLNRAFGEGGKKLRTLKAERSKVQGVRTLRDTRLQNRKTTKETRRSNPDNQSILKDYIKLRKGRELQSIGRKAISKRGGISATEANIKVFKEDRDIARWKRREAAKPAKGTVKEYASDSRKSGIQGVQRLNVGYKGAIEFPKGSRKIKRPAEQASPATLAKVGKSKGSGVQFLKSGEPLKDPSTYKPVDSSALSKVKIKKQTPEKPKTPTVKTRNAPEVASREGRKSGVVSTQRVQLNAKGKADIAKGSIPSKINQSIKVSNKNLASLPKLTGKTEVQSVKPGTRIKAAPKKPTVASGSLPPVSGTRKGTRKGTKTDPGTTKSGRGYRGEGTKSKYFWKDKRRYLTETGAAAPVRRGQKGRPKGVKSKTGKKGKGGGKGRL